jgi:hypothetical protein
MSGINEIGQRDFDSARVGTPALRGCAVTFAAMCAAMDFDPARVGTPALQFWNDTRVIANERHQ